MTFASQLSAQNSLIHTNLISRLQWQFIIKKHQNNAGLSLLTHGSTWLVLLNWLDLAPISHNTAHHKWKVGLKDLNQRDVECTFYSMYLIFNTILIICFMDAGIIFSPKIRIAYLQWFVLLTDTLYLLRI